MLKAGDLASQEDRRVKGVKIGKTRRDRGISHVCTACIQTVFNIGDDQTAVEQIDMSLCLSSMTACFCS